MNNTKQPKSISSVVLSSFGAVCAGTAALFITAILAYVSFSVGSSGYSSVAQALSTFDPALAGALLRLSAGHPATLLAELSGILTSIGCAWLFMIAVRTYNISRLFSRVVFWGTVVAWGIVLTPILLGHAVTTAALSGLPAFLWIAVVMCSVFVLGGGVFFFAGFEVSEFPDATLSSTP